MSRSANSYTEKSIRGIDNPVLQASLRKIQTGFGHGAIKWWQQNPDQEQRNRAKKSRMHTLAHADLVLEKLATNVRKNGGHVYFAETAEDAVAYTVDVARKNNVRQVVKGKSMTSMEVGIDGPLEEIGVDVAETDLGEFIIQLAGDSPSHIIAPCIHLDRTGIGKLFHEKLGNKYTDNPEELTRIAREALRAKFIKADMGLTGCNIACAETGQISLVSNEGNIRMATTLPRIHVAFMGIERIAATLDEHRDLLQLLTRGAALQKLSTYVSFVGGPSSDEDPDGAKEFHLVIIDNGRSKILADPEFREVLACIRCGACLNICPVYGKIGGHAYDSPYCGPIGAVVTPLLRGINDHADLCKGETLCGACKDVCPVENDLPRMLSALRHKLAYGDATWNVHPNDRTEAFMFSLWRRAIGSRRMYNMLIRAGRFMQKFYADDDAIFRKLPSLGANWTRHRDLPVIAKQTFSEKWAKRQTENHKETR